jgi:hypothetical protein
MVARTIENRNNTQQHELSRHPSTDEEDDTAPQAPLASTADREEGSTTPSTIRPFSPATTASEERC